MTHTQQVLVSVIVPCYNVARYVEQCLLSILQQTYTHLEILAIDDGSPDETPIILDRLAKQYSRLKVIHQKNAGVSVARNTGLSQATGDYVVFVDGDDFLAPDYMEYMLSLVYQTGAAFCLSTDCFTKQYESSTTHSKIKTITSADAVTLLLSPRIIVGCWNKIYKRSLLISHHCTFVTDLFYGEGLNFIISVAQLANKIGVGNRKVYYYRRNNESSATTRFDIEKIYNGEKALDRIETNLKIHTSAINTMLLLHRSMFYLGAAVRLQTAKLVSQYQEEYNRYLSFVRKNYMNLVFKKEVSLYRKCLLLVGCISPQLIATLDTIRRKIIAKRSV